ncbi:MAG: prolyl oligopeptidase family serine peptidase [Ilumatobacteraceae bacterium]
MADLSAPPSARRDDAADLLHGVRVADPFRWLEDGTSPEVATWVAAHNTRTREALDARPVRDEWHDRLVALTGLPTTLAVAVAGQRVFSLERSAGADQFGLVVRDAPGGPGRSLVDPADLAVDGAMAIDWFHPSPDGRLVAYGLSEGGTEQSVLHLVDVDRGVVLDERIPDTRAASVAWRREGDGFWYTRYPEGDEYHRHVRFHRIGDAQVDDAVVFDRLPTDESWPDVSISDDGRWLVVHVMVGWRRVDVHVLDLASGEWRAISEGIEAQTALHVVDGALVGVTTRDAPNGRVVRIDPDDPTTWTTVVAERNDTVLGSSAVHGADVYVVASTVAVERVERYRALGGTLLPTKTIDLGVASVVGLDVGGAGAFVARGTFGAPVDLLRIDGAHPERWSESIDPPVLPALRVTQVHYPSLDGTMVPMFVAHREDIVPSPSTPLVLTGYGGFAIAESPVWMPNLAAWCAAGGVYCVAGLRGGTEYGDAWHRAGLREHTQHVFDDFHAAADWVVAEGLTSRRLLALHGGSNGGLLMGAAITQRPDLAQAVWCAVPLLDMVRFPQFLIARLWTDEYGDPEVPDEFSWLHAYSPYHRVVAALESSTPLSHPAVLFTTAEGDTRVDPCHARKMAAAMVAASDGAAPVLLWQAGRAGHGVGKPARMRIDEGADVLTFFSWQLGLDGR